MWIRPSAVVAGFAGLALVAAVANPSEPRHVAAIRAELKRTNPVLEGVLGVGALTTRLLTYDNYVVFSRTSRNGVTVSTGAFGFVFVSSAGQKLMP